VTPNPQNTAKTTGSSGWKSAYRQDRARAGVSRLYAISEASGHNYFSVLYELTPKALKRIAMKVTEDVA
jgi:hypothetical protein